MHVVILVAGVGKRLSGMQGDLPKCLIKVGGHTLLERHIAHCHKLGARNFTLVCGFQQQAIHKYCEEVLPHFDIRWVENKQYTKGSILSAQLGLSGIKSDCLLMDADVLYHPDVLQRLFATDKSNCLLVDASAVSAGEEMMVGIEGNRVRAVARNLNQRGPFSLIGEGVGFYRLAQRDLAALQQTFEETIAEEGDKVEYEAGFDRVFGKIVFGFERIDPLPWTEIDFPADLERAEEIASKLPPVYR